MIFINLLFWGPIPVGWLWVVSHIPFLAERVFFAVVVAFVGILLTLMAALALLKQLDRAWVLVRRAAGVDQRSGVIGPVFAYTALVGASLFGLLDDLRRRPRRLAEPADLMGLLDHYKQFEELSDEEVSARLREEADERRRTALARVDDLDLSRTTWPDYPPSGVVNAITFVARAGCTATPSGSTELRAELALAHDVEPERVAVGDGASQLLASAAQALMEPGDELVTPVAVLPALPDHGPPRARHVRARSTGSPSTRSSRAVNERTRLVVLCNPNDPTGELLPVAELRRLLEALPERVVVLLDEALRDFVDAEDRDAALALLEDHPRLIAFRSFSKAWGLAGLRCGYAVGGPGAEPLHRRARPAARHQRARPGRRAGGPAPRRPHDRAPHAPRRGRAHAPARRAARAPGRGRALTGQRPVDRAPAMDGAELAARLGRQRVIVRAGGPLGDARHVRVAIQDKLATDRFLRALELALDEG